MYQLFTSIVGASVGIASVKNLLNITRNKKKKHDKIVMLAKIKLNSIATLLCQTLKDMDISHKEYIAILKEKDKYERMENISKSENEKDMCNNTSCKAMSKIMRMSSIKSGT